MGNWCTKVPDIRLLTEDIILYWKSRAIEVIHPILRGRYIGLYCEFVTIVTGKTADFSSIDLCALSLIDSVEQQVNGSYVVDKRKLERALTLAQQYNLQPQTERIKVLSLRLDAAIPVEEVKNIWSISFDLLVNRKKRLVNEEEEITIIDLLEARLEAVKLDPWATKALAERLAGYYYKKGLKTDIRRVLYLLRDSFDRHITEVPAIQASGHLQQVMQIFRLFQLNKEAEELMIRIRAVSQKSDQEFKSIAVEHDFEKDKLVEYANKVLKYDGDVMFARITKAHILPLEEIESNLEEAYQRHPIRYTVPTSIVDKKGRVLANIRPYLESKEDHQVAYLHETMQFASIYLHFIFSEGIKQGKISERVVMDFLKKSSIIDEARYNLIEVGIKNFFEENYVSCIHILIPQFEEAIRNLLEINGGNVLTFNDGTYPVKTFNHVLEDEIVKRAFGEETVYYFKVLFTDPRGWNLRNQVAHGLLEPEHFNQQTGQRLMHAFFCLGMIRWQDDPPISVEKE
ncbi:DUF4209 domain-containing protein [Pedobacter suwonensis]|uniref:DUF4209 domain-containing protein n=1 Tax=Pedobacter suwonensis TaxID=332999 RepID=UPI0038025E36